MNPRRMESELVRDNVLHVAGIARPDARRAGPRPRVRPRHPAPQPVFPAREGEAGDVPEAVRLGQRQLLLPTRRERRPAAGAGPGQQPPGARPGPRSSRASSPRRWATDGDALIHRRRLRAGPRPRPRPPRSGTPAWSYLGAAGRAARRTGRPDPFDSGPETPFPRPRTRASVPARTWSTC